jgi:hypothetical protein
MSIPPRPPRAPRRLVAASALRRAAACAGLVYLVVSLVPVVPAHATEKTKAAGTAKAAAGAKTGARTKPASRAARPSKAGARGKAGAPSRATAADAGFFLHRPANVVPNQHGKIVLFALRDDDDGQVSAQVGQLLVARGLEVVTDVRRVDTAEQYRDLATELDLVGYVDGDLRGTDAKTRATIRLRNGRSGRNMSQAIFTDSRSNLPRELSEHLWKKLGPAVARACVDAAKPRRKSRTTLRIDAGTSLEAAEDPFAEQ